MLQEPGAADGNAPLRKEFPPDETRPGVRATANGDVERLDDLREGYVRSRQSDLDRRMGSLERGKPGDQPAQGEGRQRIHVQNVGLAGGMAHFREAMSSTFPRIWRPQQIYVGPIQSSHGHVSEK